MRGDRQSLRPIHCDGFAPGNLIALVNREIYPEATYPAGQWEYQLFYEAQFHRARSTFEADVENTIRALFRRGNPASRGKPSRTAEIRRDNGSFGGAGKAPAVPRDPAVISEEDLSIYSAALARAGSYSAWYTSHDSRAAVTSRSPSSASSSRSATSRSTASASRAAQASRDA